MSDELGVGDAASFLSKMLAQSNMLIPLLSTSFRRQLELCGRDALRNHHSTISLIRAALSHSCGAFLNRALEGPVHELASHRGDLEVSGDRSWSEEVRAAGMLCEALTMFWDDLCAEMKSLPVYVMDICFFPPMLSFSRALAIRK